MAENANSTPAPKIPALPKTREDVEHLVDDLIAWLDDTDGDPDLEPYLAGIDGGPDDDREGGDVLDTGEPSLGWTDMEAGYGCSPDASFEREVDDADSEPSLGWSNHVNQALIATERDRTDLEEQNEDGDQGEDGPSWRETMDQTHLRVHL